ncbi:protein-L-isoaspartate(D-aspartate) O-methyltransferase [Roseiarcus fermentans]|uniref:Protein-L-isoaspartate O-methyltransferase n=1 Tax=Roseiarcus fermentans TaxID=1473586 RepID=A0A366EK80_9HYPH|nr:protein-L-isoaspartate O-methyltransferase [Roseiarcus fermentans]RBP02803.1 protein-L-isoaspartate(D-aspartate) O-methyltransferase [Roseiarcus fermentans]
MIRRRDFLIRAGAAALASPFAAATAFARDLAPPLADKAAFVAWGKANTREDPVYLERRFDRYKEVLSFNDLYTAAEKRAFLLTPRQEFTRPEDKDQAYVAHYIDIGFGVTITPPGTMGRMTSALQIRNGEKVLEIGTGSGYQSALLTYLTPRVYSIEIIPELAARTRGVYDRLIASGYSEYSNIATRSADGYFGWAEAAPFDKIIVTCGIDHIPPPLLQQLKPDGIMVIPVGPPGAQHILKVVKKAGADGPSVARSDIFGGKVIPFVPLTGGHQTNDGAG